MPRVLLGLKPFGNVQLLHPHTHLVAVNVMTRDALKPFPPETFRLTFDGVMGNRVEAIHVLSGATGPIQFRPLGANKVEVTLAVRDKPILVAMGKWRIVVVNDPS